MPLIADSVTLGVFDRMAKQHAILKQAVETDVVTPPDYFFDTITDPDDPDVEVYMTDASKGLDDGFVVHDTAKAFSEAAQIASQLEVHVKALGYASLDAYLAARAIDVDEDGGNFLKSSGRSLHARNVFKKSAQTLATFIITNTVTHVVAFTPGTDLQTQAQQPFVEGNFAGVDAEIVVTSVGGTAGGVLTITFKVEGTTVPTSSPQSVTIVAGIQNAVVATIPALKIVGASAVVHVSGLANGQAFLIRNKIPRVVTL